MAIVFCFAPAGHFASSCAKEVVWMFGYLDTNGDGRLSLRELYELEHNERENCLKPFLDKCDVDRSVVGVLAIFQPV